MQSEMDKLASLLLIGGTILCLLATLAASTTCTTEVLESGFEVSQYFSVTTNSTCGEGDTPTSFVTAAGEEVNCSRGDFEPAFILDGDLDTLWRSETNATPVAITFSLQQPTLSLELVGLRLTGRVSPPLVLNVQVRERGADDFITTDVSVFDDSSGSCDQYDALNIPCSNYSIEGRNSRGDFLVLVCPLTSPGSAVEDIRNLAYGYVEGFASHRTIVEANIYANIAQGYFARSLHHVTTQGETGRYLASGEEVPINSSHQEFPGFTGRGYTVLVVGGNQNPTVVQWLFPSLPRTTRYRIVFHYINRDFSRRPSVTISQGGVVYNSRVTLESDCGGPSCYAVLDNDFELTQDMMIVAMSLSSINILVDSIIAIPEEFYNATLARSLEQRDQFLADCDVTRPLTDPFCLEVATSLSIAFYSATYDCSCSLMVATSNDCQSYGGQCGCDPSDDGFTDFLGRQCDLCPLYSYQTPHGCADCECSDPLDVCDLQSGQCSNCPPLVGGRTCDRCVENSFGDPTVGCMPCSCNATGSSELCNQTTGECTCKPGVDGASCDQCNENSFNFTSSGCESCDCDIIGSIDQSCDNSGVCTCKPGVGGDKCSECLDGYFALSAVGCLPCNCSARTDECTLDPASSTSDPQELCSCPLSYNGSSCSECSDGFFLSLLTGDCEECECNGRAETCTTGSGECISCTGNTTGNSCNVCIDGFYDNDPGTNLNCQPCPCSINTSSNSSCVPDDSGNPVCFCLRGHEGQLCDSCSTGFFGDPPAFRCTSCDCNGNINTSNPLSCDQQTGVCLLCINNATGNECERCASGFYGDATNQDCQPCDCFADGSDGSLCDDITGQCSCLEGVNGQSCSQCLPGYWNFTNGVGCEACVCSDGSASPICDRVTGECTCNPGVGGADCSTCLNGYFNFTADQCSLCNCGLGAVNSSCTPNEGRCYCQPGTMGDKCDQCEPFHINLSPSGCEPCGECEQILRNDLLGVDNNAVSVTTNIDFFQMLYTDDTNGFEEIERLSMGINQNLSLTETYLGMVGDSLLQLNSSTVEVSAEVQATRNEIQYTIEEVRRIQPFAEQVHEHVLSISRAMDQVIADIAIIRLFLLESETTLASQANMSNSSLQRILSVANLHSEDFTSDVIDAQELLRLAEALSVNSDMLVSNVLTQREQADELLIKINYILSNVSDIESLLSDTELRSVQVNDALDAILMLCDQLESTVLDIIRTIELAESSLNTFDSTIANVQGALIVVRDDINTLNLLIGDVIESSGGLSMLSGSGSASGLGVGPNIETTPTTIVEGVSTLSTVVEAVEMETERCVTEVEMAQEYANMLVNVTNQINSTIFSSSAIGREAVAAIIDYADSISMIEEAIILTLATNQSIQDLNQLLDSLMVDNLHSQSNQLLQSSLTLLSDSQQLTDDVTNLLMSVGGAIDVTMVAENQSESAEMMVQGLRGEVMGFRRGAMMTNSIIERNLLMTESSLAAVGRLNEEIREDVPVLISDVSQSMDDIDNIQMMYNEADSLLESANSTAQTARDAVLDRTNLLRSITAKADINDVQLNAVDISISELMQGLQEAIDAAASIDAALRFYGDSTLSYSLPASPSQPSPATSVSMVFRPSNVSQGTMLVSSDVGTGQEGVALRLNNGSVQFEYGSNQSDVIQTAPGILREEEWYQLYATLADSSASLSVASLQGNGSTYSTSTSAITSLSQATSVRLGSNPLLPVGSGGVVTSEGGFIGCIDRVIVNNMPLALLLPDDIGNNPETCGPRPPAELRRSFVSAAWFQGAESFLQLQSAETITPSSRTLQLDFSFRTLTSNGTLLYLSDMDDSQYLIVYLTNGVLYLEYRLAMVDQTFGRTSSSYSDGQSYNVSISLEGRNASLIIGDEEIQASAPSFASQSFLPNGQFFIGRAPSDMNDGIWPESFAGCMDDLQVNGVSVDLQDRQIQVDSFRVSFEGCPAQVVSGVRFMGEGLAMFESERDEDVRSLSLTFRGSQLAALLLRVDSEPPLSISIYHTRLRVEYGDTTLLSSSSDLNDNREHNVLLEVEQEQNTNTTRLTLIVDGEASEAVSLLTSDPSPVLFGDRLYIGGTVDSSVSMVTERFRGCIDSVDINGKTLNFNDAIGLVGVSLYGCRPSSLVVPVPPPPPPLPPPPSQPPNITVGLSGENSFIALQVNEDDVIDGYSIVLEFQSVSQDGLLLYTQGSIHTKDFMALQLLNGRLVYSFDLGTGRVDISSQQSYNDGIIHLVELRRRGQLGEMIINEGAEYQNGSSPGSFSSLNINTGYLFVGGVANTIQPITLQQPGDDLVVSAAACIHSLSINGVYENFSTPLASQGTGSCLDRYSNAATFNASSYVQLFERFSVGVRFGVTFEFRTTQCSGLLLYVASPVYPDHLLLELLNGSLRFVFDNGPLEEEVIHMPSPPDSSSLCDGQFHSLTVIKDGIKGSINIDGTVTMVTSRFGAFIAVNTNDPLYIGGLPATERPRFTVRAERSFQGCIRNLSFSEDSVEFEQVLLTDASDFKNVDMNICRN